MTSTLAHIHDLNVARGVRAAGRLVPGRWPDPVTQREAPNVCKLRPRRGARAAA